jgi:hypothetical protein
MKTTILNEKKLFQTLCQIENETDNGLIINQLGIDF